MVSSEGRDLVGAHIIEGTDVQEKMGLLVSAERVQANNLDIWQCVVVHLAVNTVTVSSFIIALVASQVWNSGREDPAFLPASRMWDPGRDDSIGRDPAHPHSLLDLGRDQVRPHSSADLGRDQSRPHSSPDPERDLANLLSSSQRLQSDGKEVVELDDEHWVLKVTGTGRVLSADQSVEAVEYVLLELTNLGRSPPSENSHNELLTLGAHLRG